MKPELYIYWRVPSAQLPLALKAAQRLQSALQNRYGGLIARLLLRADADGSAHATVMEVYTHPAGVSGGMQRDIEVLAAEHLAALVPGPQRHVETFGPV